MFRVRCLLLTHGERESTTIHFMRIVTWNVNGIRSLIKEYGSIDCVFDKLKADVVCIQVVLLSLLSF